MSQTVPTEKLKTDSLAGLLFDLDGTLLDTYDIILHSMRHTVNDTYGLSLTDEELMRGVGTPLYDQMLTFTHGDSDKAAELTQIYREHNKEVHDRQIKAFPHTIEALKRFAARGLKMGIVTSKRHALAQRGLDLTELSPYFTVLIGSDDTDLHKPNPAPVIVGCEQLEISPDQILYIGDSPYDMQAGNGAGCQTVAATWGMFSEDTLRAQNPTIMCKQLTDLASLLEQ
ncbi:HAD family hydrolase [Adlercreutzia agrestimuris]|uniref:HAD family hydrolase n=1 Tax=Adlercreutzia agrestimuris TaxID=2941324 RepID=UPI00203DA20D|nr:HAD-IA family hydrolase [Adlercreutzia agrestimuris]